MDHEVRDHHSRFSIECTLCQGDFVCGLTVNFYAEPDVDNVYVAEFQHRFGSKHAFLEAYRLAVRSYDCSEDFIASPFLACVPTGMPACLPPSCTLSEVFALL